MQSKTLKWMDKIIGTSLCFSLGLFDQILHFFIKRPPFEPASIKKILIIKLVAIGDLVVALPTLKAIREEFSKANISLLTTPRVKEIAENIPFVDEIIYYDPFKTHRGISGILRMCFMLKNKGFDLVVELEHYYRVTTFFSYFSGAKHSVGFDLPMQGRRGLFTIKVPYDVNKHELEVFLDMARAIGVKNTNPSLIEISFSKEDERYVKNLLAKLTEASSLLIGIHVGTGKSAISRRWINKRWAKLADILIEKYNAKVIFTGAEVEKGIVAEITKYMKHKATNLVGKTTLKQFAALTKQCDLFISLDTGPMHIVAAQKTPVVALFGPNTPKKWGPYGDNHRVIYKALPCSPCTQQYRGKVSNCKNNICMQKITVEDVLKAVDELIRKHAKKDGPEDNTTLR